MENEEQEFTQQDELDLFNIAFRKFGSHAQMQVAIEECSELAAAIARFSNGRGGFEEMCDEMADVEIMIEQIKFHYRAYGDVEKAKDFKLRRLYERLHGPSINEKDI